jgi:hypothetical protein
MRRARDSKGRFLKRGSARRNDPGRKKSRRRRVGRQRMSFAAAPRRRNYPANPRKRAVRKYRRNPLTGSAFGLDLGEMKTAGYVVIGVIGVPFIEGFAGNIIPTTWASNKLVSYGVKFASAFGLGYLGKMVLGKEAGKLIFVGGLTYLAMSLIKDYIPGLTTTSLSGMRSQPLLGKYLGASRGMGGGMGSYITNRAPERLRPENRY